MGAVHRVLLRRDASAGFSGSVTLPHVALWWPHTHGEPALCQVRLLARVRDLPEPLVTELGATGFRTLRLEISGGPLALHVNGVPVFCRGACWTPLDVVSLRAPPAAIRAAVAQARDANMNMLRVAGSMAYEDAAFFDACDEQGMLVWQDFMFSNMDYPEHDAAFMADVRVEVGQHTRSWQGRPALAVMRQRRGGTTSGHVGCNAGAVEPAAVSRDVAAAGERHTA